jgi:hypothetical protein
MNIEQAVQELQDQQKRDYLRVLSHCLALQQCLAEQIASSVATPKSPEWVQAKETGKQYIDQLQKAALDKIYAGMDKLIPPGDVARLDRREVDDLPK